ncbi:MAG: hypothetical protein IJ754_03200 [Bacteroidaceae bacterium]|nr:hypothetical protein [Bacteroidaceae bacterium]
MRLFRRPWIWLSRFRQRKGYGVHSPFAYSFIRGVVLESSAYYAYADLAPLHPWWVRWFRLYPMQCRRLLFRLANFAEPRTVELRTADEVAAKYIRAAVPRAEVRRKEGAIPGEVRRKEGAMSGEVRRKEGGLAAVPEGSPEGVVLRKEGAMSGEVRRKEGGLAAVPEGSPEGREAADFVLVGKEWLEEAAAVAARMPERGMLVCEGIHESARAKEIWRTIREAPHTGVTFDLYTYGVAFFNPKLHKQHYKVNF